MGRQDLTMLLLLVVGVLISLTSVHGQILRQEYGQICNMTDNNTCISANILDPLVCKKSTTEDGDEGRCQCYDEMFRHEELGRCVSPANQGCTVSSGDGDPMWTCTVNAQCWPNGNPKEEQGVNAVRNNGTCHCDADAKYDQISGKCKLDFGSTRCKMETDCDVLRLLTCRNGTCVCQDEVHQVYNKLEERCEVLAQGSCVQKPPFVEPRCGPNMNCTSGLCQCDTDFTETLERTCVKQYDAECEKDSDCDPHFECRGPDEGPKKCLCRLEQEYYNGECLLLVGHECGTENFTDFNCTFRASCQNEICSCDDGYEKNTTTNKCMGLYGAACPTEESILCKSEDFLICDNSTCACKANYEGNDNDNKCRGYIGQECRIDSGDDCIANSVCANDNNGTCACGEKQVPGQDNKSCMGVLDGVCSMEYPCSDSHYVTCINAKCDCKNHEVQLPEGDHCVAKADNLCNDGISCVSNSTCSAEEPKMCRCTPGLVGDGKGYCIKQENNGGSSTVFMSSTLFALALIMTI